MMYLYISYTFTSHTLNGGGATVRLAQVALQQKGVQLTSILNTYSHLIL
jgi:hypothetical protein